MKVVLIAINPQNGKIYWSKSPGLLVDLTLQAIGQDDSQLLIGGKFVLDLRDGKQLWPVQ